MISTAKRLCSSPATNLQHVDASKIMADINSLQNELTRFHSSLPTDVLLCDQSISRYMASSERPGYVFLHCHLAGCHIDLYRYFLPGQKDKIPLEILRKLPREFLARSQKQAVAHSMSFGRFCDAIQTEVEQMRDTGKQELAADYSTIQVGTACVRVLLTAIQHQLFRDVSQETTAPLWRLGTTDETHLRFLVQAVQRVTEPWCGWLNMAQQAFDHNKALLDEFDKTRTVMDHRGVDRADLSRTDGDSRLPGTDALLASVAMGTMEDPMRNLTIDATSAERWLHASQMSTGAALSYPTPPTASFGIEPGTPGIPLLLAQARTASMDASEMAGLYDSESAMLGLANLTGTLGPGSALVTPSDVPLMQMGGTIDPAMYQHPHHQHSHEQQQQQQQQHHHHHHHQSPPPLPLPHQQHQQGGPAAGFSLAQHGMFLDAYAGHFASSHHRDPNGFGQQAGFG